MQGFERADRQFLDAAALAGHLVPEGSMFAFLAAHRAGVWRFAADSPAELAKIAAHAPGAAVYARVATVAGAGNVGSEGKFGVHPGPPTALASTSSRGYRRSSVGGELRAVLPSWTWAASWPGVLKEVEIYDRS